MANSKRQKHVAAEGQLNPTLYADQPVTGGETKIVINELQVRQVVRNVLEIQDWRNALTGADSRYNPNRTRLYDIYSDILLDGHLSGIVTKRIDAVLNKPLFYKSADGNVVDAMTKFIRSWEFRKVMHYILDTLFWGITGIEFVPGAEFRARLIPRKHIKPKTQIISIEQNSQDEGIPYTALDNVWVIGEAEDLGLLLKCAPHVIYKRGMFGDWSQYIEVFGIPIRTMHYDANDQQTKLELKQVLDGSGSALSMMIPKGVEFKIEDGKTSNGDGKLQDTFNRALNNELSIIVLGNTETTTSSNYSGASLAKSKVHLEQQNEIAKNDIAYLCAQLNAPHFHKILQSYGLPVAEAGYVEINKDIDIDFLAQRVQIDTALLNAGVQLTQEYFRETYNLPKPEAGETLVNAAM
ncbi:MAG: hypothetical protein K0Q79_1515 [Flavipsychrobacter sp.]|jgi:hypothetical protein|nr:hypothetical protein [Flavipsychrobacter sp.]